MLIMKRYLNNGDVIVNPVTFYRIEKVTEDIARLSPLSPPNKRLVNRVWYGDPEMEGCSPCADVFESQEPNDIKELVMETEAGRVIHTVTAPRAVDSAGDAGQAHDIKFPPGHDMDAEDVPPYAGEDVDKRSGMEQAVADEEGRN